MSNNNNSNVVWTLVGLCIGVLILGYLALKSVADMLSVDIKTLGWMIFFAAIIICLIVLAIAFEFKCWLPFTLAAAWFIMTPALKYWSRLSVDVLSERAGIETLDPVYDWYGRLGYQGLIIAGLIIVGVAARGLFCPNR
ncbi:hypothetical protein RGU72_04855 [Undibacterium sp. 5I1]|uniref:hypothetical protein n=1 Tax=unclassified Undibacterium TaxID=2630295 RepID=UPI002AB5DC3F|nr:MULTISPECIES: hypothetical protein [unclassified Undibacterium]MDY7537582.1 hypothetical protein [Undibacterium sp. 5I1]MEB0231967.1 hypothetical protein [Undibacterium sp. 10I3]MEB0256318.1 hypothetical protein [Undibacterium sp. 5I1]